MQSMKVPFSGCHYHTIPTGIAYTYKCMHPCNHIFTSTQVVLDCPTICVVTTHSCDAIYCRRLSTGCEYIKSTRRASPAYRSPQWAPISKVLIHVHCIVIGAPCHGQHVPDKLLNTFGHKYGTDIGPCFHACDSNILLNHAALAALFPKIIWTYHCATFLLPSRAVARMSKGSADFL